jgi:hypothetical protein
MVNVTRVERTSERLSNVGLGGKIVNFIRLYSFNRPSDALVLRELQRDSLDGLRNTRRATATITTKDTIAQSK